jgi:hypothetical protein
MKHNDGRLEVVRERHGIVERQTRAFQEIRCEQNSFDLRRCEHSELPLSLS